ncbi:MarC family integral membrane protein [Candidatus Methanoperedenaceae archaeon GB50]|nr:MarC family integral membrane protein [Candidatus Methanoperedenaceae archaeon GB37]CAD7768344.1 MarC family integral membrane protein [Candidatus Methanoperedenaceae archaeon GB50]CAD7774398.1 MAG: MarC family integral membrane protein [Candidatus Methanoperedenaceae archaeon GB50]
MGDFHAFFLQTFVAIFIIVDPVANIMVFLSLTEGKSAGERKRISLKAALFGCLILLIFAIFGDFILSFFHITIDSLRVIGGILILAIAMDMLYGRLSREGYTPEEALESGVREDIAFFPLAVPMLAGPGAITTVILLMEAARSLVFDILVLVAIVLTFFITWILFVASEEIHRLLGVTGLRVITRMMGLILGAIAVQFITSGLWNIYLSLSASGV